MLSTERLVDDLRGLGVKPGDTLMPHVSLRAIGPLDGGPATLLDALGQAVGDAGTLIMILGADIEHDWVNEHPETEREALLSGATPFDPATAPIFGEVGYFAEVFRRTAGTRVTDNPSGRFGARGCLAEQLLRDAPWDDYYGPGSPLERLCDCGGKVVRLGANPDTTTVLHYAEYLADVPNKRRVRRHYLCHGAGDPVVRPVECLDDNDGIVPFAGEDYFALILREYLSRGQVKRGQVGHAQAELIEAKDLVAFGTKWMTENLPPG